ncbi:MAG TPA: O-antigen ligase family protein [Candidatus Acidoferrum sp.]|nr:O-antigen ligase family protein [Candidatus Acidoferrum sp.]
MAQLSLYAFMLVYIGRIQELVAWLEPLRIVLIFTLFAVVSALLLPCGERHLIWRKREVRLVLLLAGLAVTSMPFSAWPGFTYAFIIGPFALVVLLFLLIVAVTTSQRIATSLVLTLLSAVVALSAFTLLGGEALGGSGRAYATKTYDPNDLAMVIDCALPFAVLGAFSLRGPGRLVAGAATVFGVVAVVKTISRGGFIGLVLVGVLLVFRWRSVSLIRRLTVLLACAVILSVSVPSNYWYSIGTVFNLNPSDDDSYLESGIRGRSDMWMQGLIVFSQHPILGVGAGAFEIAEGLSHGGAGKWSAAHNSFIQIASELGIVGFAVFAALIVLSVRNARAVARAARARVELAPIEWIATAVEMSLYTYIVVGFALSQAYSSVLYFLFGMATALRLQVERDAAIVAPSATAPVVRERRSQRS